MKPKEDIITYAQKMQYIGVNRNVAFDAYRQMYHSGWDLPPAVRNIEWIQKVVNADCYDAIQTGMRILATIPLSLTYQPMAPGQENKERAGIYETVLKWNLMAANRRRSRTVEAEIAKNALLYDMAVVRIVDLEYEINERKKLKLPTKREEEALAQGRFMVVPYDSRSVFYDWSNLGLERVLIVEHKHAQEIIDEWGEAASKYPALVDLAKKPLDDSWITVYDYWDLDTRMTWVAEGQQNTLANTGAEQLKWVLNYGEMPLDFLPFAIRGGSGLELSGPHQFQPLLYPVYATGAWDIKNIVRSLEVSEVIAHTGSPRLVEEGPNQQPSKTEYMAPDRVTKMAPGNTLRQIPPATIDAALQGVDALLSAQISKSTISDVLQGGELPSGTAFATLNLMTQTAVGVLKPFQYLAEMVLADMFTIMLRYVAFTEKTLYGYGTGKSDYGKEYKVEPQYIEPAAIYISVALHPDTPTDRGQKIAAAVQAVQGLNLSMETGLDEIGIEDPQAEIKKWASEQIFNHEMEMEFQRELLEMQASIEMKVQVAMMQLQQALAGAQQQQGPPEFAGQAGPEAPLGPEGSPPGMDPSQGQPPPAMFEPGAQAEDSGIPMAPEGGGELL